MHFDQYCDTENITLSPWQKEAANVFLNALYPERKAATGKTFLIKLLDRFLKSHGNNFKRNEKARLNKIELAAMGIELARRLKRIGEIIESVDNRCMAADGPVTPTLEEITQAEFSEIYELTK